VCVSMYPVNNFKIAGLLPRYSVCWFVLRQSSSRW